MSKARAVNGEGISLLPGSSIRPVLLKLKSFLPAASGVVSSAGADPRHERKQNCRLDIVPALGRHECIVSVWQGFGGGEATGVVL